MIQSGHAGPDTSATLRTQKLRCNYDDEADSRPQNSSAHDQGVVILNRLASYTPNGGMGIEVGPRPLMHVQRTYLLSVLVAVQQAGEAYQAHMRPYNSIHPLATKIFLLPRVGGAAAVVVVGKRTISECSPSSFQI